MIKTCILVLLVLTIAPPVLADPLEDDFPLTAPLTEDTCLYVDPSASNPVAVAEC